MSEWDSLAEEAVAGSYNGAPRCHVARMYEELPDEAIAPVKAAMKNRNISAAALATSLAKRLGDRAPKSHSIGQHRRGACRCKED